MRVSKGARLSAQSFRIRAEILLGPDAFLGFRVSSSFITPGSCMTMSSMSGRGSPSGTGMSDWSSLVNTDLYCLFRMFALSFAPLNSLPCSRKGEMPVLSFFREEI